MIKKRSFKKDIFPFSLALVSMAYSLYFYFFIPDISNRKFNIVFFVWEFSKKSDIFFIAGLIALSCLGFFLLDRIYFKKSIERRFYYFWEFYAASNFALLTMLSYQYGAVMYLTKENADFYTYFSPVGSIAFFIGVVFILRLILRSGSRLLYDEEAEVNE
jgi:hypothetical protein